MRVLILCTGNSCRSIIAEALINEKLEYIHAESSGVKASGHVNENAKRVLEENGIWSDSYHSKVIESLQGREFDLVVTVCDNAKENCPLFSTETKVIHVGFEDPDGKPYEAFLDTYNKIVSILLPKIEDIAMVKKKGLR